MGYEPRFFTLHWNNDYCRFLTRMGMEGQKLRFVWGGHNQLTRFSRHNVSAGDFIIPVRVIRQTLFVVAKMRVAEVLTRAEYLARHPLDELLIVDECADEVLAGVKGTPIRFDVPVTGDTLAGLRFVSKKGERGLKHVEGGKLLRSTSLEGLYRLAPESARVLTSLLDEQPAARLDENTQT